MKKIIISFLIVIMVLTLSITVSAETKTYSKTHSSPDSFLVDWQIQVQYHDSTHTSLIGVMLYGYDTTLINEDYVNTRGYNHYSSQPGLKRGSGSITWGTKKLPGYLSTLDRMHTSIPVTYYIKLSK